MLRKIKNLKKRFIRDLIEQDNLVQIYKFLLKENANAISPGIGCIIFSKDRAMQLEALLRSFFFLKKGKCEIFVIYSATDPLHQQAYYDLIEIFDLKVNFIPQQGKSDFKEKLLSTIKVMCAGKLLFLVDDILITEEFDLAELEIVDTSRNIFSLRMGENLSYSYVVKKDQPLPDLERSNRMICWDWHKSKLDWGYPLSVDGHLFNKKEMEILVEHLHYFSPNTFEDALQSVKDIFEVRKGVAYSKSAIFNNPCNKVQSDVDNYHGMIHQDILLKYWIEGKRINFEHYLGYNNKSVHEEIDLEFTDRYGK